MSKLLCQNVFLQFGNVAVGLYSGVRLVSFYFSVESWNVDCKQEVKVKQNFTQNKFFKKSWNRRLIHQFLGPRKKIENLSQRPIYSIFPSLSKTFLSTQRDVKIKFFFFFKDQFFENVQNVSGVSILARCDQSGR